jgi:hypothetical protein
MLAEKARDDIASLIVKLGSRAMSLRGESLSATSFLFRSVPHPGQHHGREYVSGTEGISEGAAIGALAVSATFGKNGVQNAIIVAILMIVTDSARS